MKKITLALVLICAVFLTACGTAVKAPEEADGLTLTVQAADAAGLSFTVANEGKSTWKVGSAVYLSLHKENGYWEELADDTPFTPSSTTLKPGSRLSQDLALGQPLQPGEYRLTVYLENTQSGQAVSLTAEFEIK